jgi:hypothetical protein
METRHALRRACQLRNYSTGLPTRKGSGSLTPTQRLSGQCSSQQINGARLGLRPGSTFGRQYSTASPLPSSNDTFLKVLTTNYYGGDDGFGRIRCDEISLGKEGHRIAKVTIQNSSVGNSLNVSLLQNITTTFRELSLKEDLRCVVLTGDKGFCTGMVSRDPYIQRHCTKHNSD